MNILCDTHVLLWYLEGRTDMLSPRTVDMMLHSTACCCVRLQWTACCLSRGTGTCFSTPTS